MVSIMHDFIMWAIIINLLFLYFSDFNVFLDIIAKITFFSKLKIKINEMLNFLIIIINLISFILALRFVNKENGEIFVNLWAGICLVTILLAIITNVYNIFKGKAKLNKLVFILFPFLYFLLYSRGQEKLSFEYITQYILNTNLIMKYNFVVLFFILFFTIISINLLLIINCLINKFKEQAYYINIRLNSVIFFTLLSNIIGLLFLSEFSIENLDREKINNILDVYKLVISSLLIPAFFTILLDRNKSKEKKEVVINYYNNSAQKRRRKY